MDISTLARRTEGDEGLKSDAVSANWWCDFGDGGGAIIYFQNISYSCWFLQHYHTLSTFHSFNVSGKLTLPQGVRGEGRILSKSSMWPLGKCKSNIHSFLALSLVATNCWDTEQVMFSGFLELFWKQLPAAAKNDAMRAVRVNQNSKVAGES